MSKRIVITGMGCVTPIGNNVEEFFNNLNNGVNGIGLLTRVDSSLFKTSVAAEIKNFDPEGIVDKKDIKRMDLYTQYALVAADQALKDSDIVGTIDPNLLATVVSSGIGGLQTIEDNVMRFVEKGARFVSPTYIPSAISNIAAGTIAIKANARGTCTSITTACAAGTHAIIEGFRLINEGRAQAVICGGSEAPITATGVSGFANMTALNTTDDINRASIPFDKERSGFVIGEGSGILILEELEHALARNAKIYAEVIGYGSTCDAYHITAPSGEGAIRCMEEALITSGLNITDIDYINAHGTSTPLNDLHESNAIKAVFKDHTKDLLVSSTKSMTGHLLGATGAIEAMACVNALNSGIIPPTINYKVVDEELDLNYVPNNAINKDITYAMSNTFGFGGHNATIILKKWCK